MLRVLKPGPVRLGLDWGRICKLGQGIHDRYGHNDDTGRLGRES